MRLLHVSFFLSAVLLVGGGAPAEDRGRTVQMTVTEDGFVPDVVRVKRGERVTLVVTRKVEKTCATEIVIKDYGIRAKLPLGKPVAVSFTPTETGNVRYACGMDMIAGNLIVE
jgi:plastocyanin domain-containing protein